MVRPRSIETIVVSAIVVAATAVIGSTVAAQQTAPPVFRSTINLTQLDVTVLDKEHRPVHGLTAADFTILEDGVPRPIEVVTPVDLPEGGTPQSAAWTRDVTPDVTTNTVAMDGRVFVIVMDDALMPANGDMNHASDLWPVEATRKTAVSVVNRLRPEDLAAVVFTLDGHGAEGLTGDRTLLLKAVNSLARIGNTLAHPDGRPTSNATGPPCAAYLQSINVVRDAAVYLAALPQRRKSVVYISGGMAIDLSTHRILGALYPGTPMDRANCGTSVVQSMKETFRDAQAANVAIYGFDPVGLRPRAALDSAEGSIVQFVQTVSENTGGRATVNTNDFEPGIAQMYLENGSYYLLGYRSAANSAKGPTQLKVTVRQPGLEVRTRHEVWTAPAPASQSKGSTSSATATPSGILPNMNTPLRVAAMPALRTGHPTPSVAVVLGVSQPLPEEARQEVLEVTVRAFTKDGEPRGSHSETVTLALAPRSAAHDRVTYEVASTLDLKPGQYELRVYAHNKATGAEGSVYTTVDVPDFNKSRPSLSGVFVASKPGVPMLAKQMIDGWLTDSPTTVRDYGKSDVVTAAVFVYQGGNAKLVSIPMTARVINEHGDVVHRDSATLAASGFERSRSAAYSVSLPLDGLPPGAYLLTFTLGDGQGEQTRDVRFTVR